MATGIQTGMRTGSGPLATGRGPLGKGPGGGANKGGLGKLGTMWSGLNRKVKILIICAIGLLVAGGVVFGMVSSANQPVELYATKLSEDDVKDVSMKLQEWGIPHTVAVTNDNLMISPQLKVTAQAKLASHGLPRHAIMTAATQPASSGINTMTEKEKDAIRQRVLEGELTESMRQMDGVADAYVRLGLPEKTLFDNGQEGAKAAVMLKMKPGSQLNRDQVTGIVNLVAYSVPNLKAENVKIVDTNGRDLTANLPGAPGMVGGMAPNGQLEYKLNLEKNLKDKVEQQLATVLGSQKFAAQVTAEIDFSQSEVNREVVGGPEDNGKVRVGGQKRVEQYNKKADTSGAVQMSSTGDKKGTYVKSEESDKYEVNRTVTHNVDTSPRIQRLTVSVAVDNLKDDQVAAIAGLVKDAIGINESRGDSVTVRSVPFAQASLDGIYSEMAQGMANGTAPAVPQTTGMNTTAIAVAAFVPAVLLLTIIAVFVTKQRQVQAGRSELLLGTATGNASSDISDLLTQKDGKSKEMGETRVNSSDQLQQLVNERPAKVAELLKNTWLNGDQR
ncbi:MAG: flagellar M-ring protein FliF [bacterium]|nr:flagellar M-ring protein FliF [bacterium]